MNNFNIITNLKAREVLDSRGNPTVEAEITLDKTHSGRAISPSGASVGTKEALELRDKDSRYLGKGVLKAVSNVNSVIAKNILNKTFSSQSEFDKFLIDLDGTENKSKLGANAILACSLAYAKAVAVKNNMPLYKYIGAGKTLPKCYMNIINGGAHADNALDFQEFMIVPSGFLKFNEALRAGAEVFHTLKKILHDKGHNTNVGDEGGFAPNLKSAEEALDLISESITKAGYKLGENINIALDVAASEFYENGKYKLGNFSQPLSNSEMVDYYSKLRKNYPIISIEDPMSEHDWDGWKIITETLGKTTQIVGDDVFVTNPKIIQKGIDEKVANSVLIKLNQIGTLTETLEAIELAHKNNYSTIVSHRSGETEDTTIAHLAVGSGSAQIKTGSLSRTDRICKYNELLRIAEELE